MHLSLVQMNFNLVEIGSVHYDDISPAGNGIRPFVCARWHGCSFLLRVASEGKLDPPGRGVTDGPALPSRPPAANVTPAAATWEPHQEAGAKEADGVVHMRPNRGENIAF